MSGKADCKIYMLVKRFISRLFNGGTRPGNALKSSKLETFNGNYDNLWELPGIWRKLKQTMFKHTYRYIFMHVNYYHIFLWYIWY